MTLKQLAERHILSFIPQKRTPYIRYMQRREDSEHLMFPHEIYEDLRKRFQRRIEAMLSYATTDNQCRSRQLLRYFGQTDSYDCGHCDVCLDIRKNDDKVSSAREAILSLLADGQSVHVTRLRSIPLPYEIIEDALRYLLETGAVCQDDGFLVAQK